MNFVPWFLDKGYWTRRAACNMAATAMQSQQDFFGEYQCARVWSLVVFFEMYMHEGADGTHEDFGPKQPAQLTDVKSTAEKCS